MPPTLANTILFFFFFFCRIIALYCYVGFHRTTTWINHLLLFSQSLVWLFVTSWTAVLQASLSFTISRSLLKFMSVESVIIIYIYPHPLEAAPNPTPQGHHTWQTPFSLPLWSWQAHFFLCVCFSLLCFANVAFFFLFLQIEGLWQPCIEQVYWHHFSNSIFSLCISVSHFGNSPDILSFFIIITFTMIAISDLWRYDHNCFGAPRIAPIQDS